MSPGKGLWPTWTLQTGEPEAPDKVRPPATAKGRRWPRARGQREEGSQATQTSPGGEQPPPAWSPSPLYPTQQNLQMIPGPHLALRPGHGGLGKIRILIFVSRKPNRRHAGLCPGCLRLCGGRGGMKQATGLPPSALQKLQSGPLSLPPYWGSLGPEGHRSDLVPSSAAPADATLPDLTPHASSTRTRTHKGTFWWWWWWWCFFCLFFFFPMHITKGKGKGL